MRHTALVTSLTWMLILVGGALPDLAEAQDGQAKAAPGDPKIWSGVYTAAQAERGKQVFLNTCTTCHSFDLTGNNGRGPALVGDAFMANWEAETLNHLFTRMKSTMPRNNPASLTEPVYLDLLAYILQANKFPDGAGSLQADALGSIAIVGKGDARTVPNFAMVELVGCLERADKHWMLTKTSEPLATKDQPPSPAELTEAAARPVGAEAFRLMSVHPFKPDAHQGHKVQAKGLLYRATNDNRLNVTSLEPVGGACAN